AIQTIIVTDIEAPVVTAPTDITHATDAGVCSYTVDPGTATAADNCGVGTPTGVRSDALLLSAPYPVGTTTINWSVTDIHGNAASAIQTIIVTDNEAPVVTAPADISHATTAGACSYTGDP